jgi:hypothetical protein
VEAEAERNCGPRLASPCRLADVLVAAVVIVEVVVVALLA